MDSLTVSHLIARYNLEPHPEGGWFKETYRSTEKLMPLGLPNRFHGERAMSTAIYFLLEQGQFSAFHRIKSDECWHFYAGQSLDILIIHPEGRLETVKLGPDPEAGDHFQWVVPAECWFASKPAFNSMFSFVGCTVAPGFDFADFELAQADILTIQYPQHEAIIRSLCR